MSYLASKPEQSDDNEIALLQSLDSLAVSGATQAIRKTSATTVANVDVGSSGGGHTIQEEGVSLTQRTKLNFVGAGVTVTDGGAGTDDTIVTIPGGGHTIKNAGTALTTRTGLNFLAPLTATDDAAGDETEISLDSDVTTRTVGITLDGQGGVISTGLKGFLRVPYNGTITGWTILADQSGSIVVDVWKDVLANFPPTVADTIAGTEKPTLSSQTNNADTSLSSWTTAVTSGDILAFNVDSASTVTRVNLFIHINTA